MIKYLFLINQRNLIRKRKTFNCFLNEIILLLGLPHFIIKQIIFLGGPLVYCFGKYFHSVVPLTLAYRWTKISVTNSNEEYEWGNQNMQQIQCKGFKKFKFISIHFAYLVSQSSLNETHSI